MRGGLEHLEQLRGAAQGAGVGLAVLGRELVGIAQALKLKKQRGFQIEFAGIVGGFDEGFRVEGRSSEEKQCEERFGSHRGDAIVLGGRSEGVLYAHVVKLLAFALFESGCAVVRH